jgi:predicted MFS family arabinose efflux permease
MAVKRKIHYGWIVAALVFVSMLVAASIRSTSGVLLVPLQQEFGWSRSEISLAFAINLTLYGFSGPFIAALMERFGVRKMMVGGLLFLVIGTTLSLGMKQVWHLQVLWGIVVGLGSGVFLTVLGATVASRWFEVRRGMVLGLLTASTATGQLVFLPLLAHLIEAYSWRVAVGMMAGVGLLLVPLILIFMRDLPSDKGLLPYGATDEGQVQANRKRNPIAMAFAGLMIGVRSFDFWLLAGSFFICGLSTSGLIGTHFISACLDHGIQEVTAAGMLAFMGVFDIIGTTMSGFLSDRFNNRWLLFWYYGLRGLALLLLPQSLDLASTGSFTTLFVFAVFYGLDWIATVPPTVRLTAEIFGKENSSIVYGWIYAAHQLGSGVAAYGGGLMYQLFDSYSMTFLVAGAFCVLATLMVLRVGRGGRIRIEQQVRVQDQL